MRFLPPASVLPTLLVSPLWAQDFVLTPSFSVEQIYTDNIALAPPGLERGDWVTVVRPTVRFGYNGTNVKLIATYTPEIVFRANDGALNVYNQFSLVPSGGHGDSIKLVENLLYLDVTANVAQGNDSLAAPLTNRNINTTGNRSTYGTVSLSPYLRYDFSREATGELRYAYTLVGSNSTSTSFSNSGSNRVSAALVSGPGYRFTSWGLTYSRETITYDSGQDTSFQRFNAGVRQQITPFVFALANAGYDDDSYQTTTGESPSGTSWDVGINWIPTPRTNFTATTGRRYFGKTNTLAFSHRTRLTTWSLSRTEDITTTRSQFLQPNQADTATVLDTLFLSRIPDPVERQRAVQQEIQRLGLPPTLAVPVNFLTDQVFVQKSWNGSVALQGPIHTFVTNIYTLDRQAQSVAPPGGAGDFALSSSIDQRGGSFAWSWRITPLTSSITYLGLSHNRAPGTGRVDEYRNFRIGLSSTLGPRTSGSLSYEHIENDSNALGSSYKENRVSALVGMRF